MWNSAVFLSARSTDQNFLCFQKKPQPHTLTHAGICTLPLIFISILGMILTQDTAGQKQNQETQGEQWPGSSGLSQGQVEETVGNYYPLPTCPHQAFLLATPRSRLWFDSWHISAAGIAFLVRSWQHGLTPLPVSLDSIPALCPSLSCCLLPDLSSLYWLPVPESTRLLVWSSWLWS